MLRSAALAAFLSSVFTAFAQDSLRKEVGAVRGSGTLRIDGSLDEADWQRATPTSGFTQFEPRPNSAPTHDTEVRLLYDDDALYVGALLFDTAPDSVLKRLWPRDEVEIGDWFNVTIDAYRSGINGYEFIVSAANVQTDLVIADEEEDESWNAVWQSAVGLDERGWVVEMRIPWSALRFPEAVEQDWHINFVRVVGRTREKSFWSKVDPAVEGWLRQAGRLTGIRDIRPPLRLALYPYASVYFEHYPYGIEGVNDWSRSLNGGMDVKYGLSDAYTLDMTLVPDFGQVISDNVVLNLSPFEVQFNENRQFFIEGTELFQRGELFYSRRIGGEPLLRDDLYDGLADGDEVIEDPETSQLINATKVSGRGRKGLGFGVLNAITSTTYAIVRDSMGTEREVLTDPLTNYNVFVADQLLPNNGTVSFTNASVLRDGATYDANSSALSFTVNNEARSFQMEGLAAGAWQFDPAVERTPGHRAYLAAAKTGGNWNYGGAVFQTDPEFDANDLGIYNYTNVRGAESEITFTNFKPAGRWMRWRFGLESEYLRVIDPDHFHNLAIELNHFRVDRRFNAYGGHVRVEPIITYDPYEPRVPGRLYEYPRNAEVGAWVSTDYSKVFAVDARFQARWFDEHDPDAGAADRRSFYAEFEPRLRIGDRLFVYTGVTHWFGDEDVGWVAFNDEDIILGRRDLWTTTALLQARVIMTNRMSLSTRVRHYWSRAHYVGFHRLEDDSSIGHTDYIGTDADGSPLHDVDFDAFNVDMFWSWFFAPGSVITVGWKNSIYSDSRTITENYFDDLSSTLAAPQTNSLSLKVLYYVDAGALLKRR